MRFATKWLKIYRIPGGIAIGSIFVLHAAGWLQIPTLRRIENTFYDLRIVIVTIDEESRVGWAAFFCPPFYCLSWQALRRSG